MNQQLEEFIHSPEYDDVYDLYDRQCNDANEVASKMELLKTKLEDLIAELRK